MRSKRRMQFVLATSIAVSGTAAADVLTWDGDLDTNNGWSAQSQGETNWDPESIPSIADDCSISDAVVWIDVLQAEAKTLFAGGSLEIPAFAELEVALSAQLTSAQINGMITSPGSIEFVGSTTFGRILRGGGFFHNVDSMTISGAAFIGDPGNPAVPIEFLNSGMVAVNQNLTVIDNSVFTNDGTVSLVKNIGGAGLIVNRGVIESTTPGLRSLGRVRQESGEIAVTNGELWVDDVTDLFGGEIHVLSPGVLRFRGISETTTFGGLTRISGEGLVRLESGPNFNLQITENLECAVGVPFGSANEVALLHNTNADAVLTNKGRFTWAGGQVRGNGDLVNAAGAEMRIMPGGGNLGLDLVNESGGTLTQLSSLNELSGWTATATNERDATWIITRGDMGSGLDFTSRGLLVKRDDGVTEAFPSKLGGTTLIDGSTVRGESSELLLGGTCTWIDAVIEPATETGAIRLVGTTHQVQGLLTIQGAGKASIGPQFTEFVQVVMSRGAEVRNELPAAAPTEAQPFELRGSAEIFDGKLTNAGGMEIVSGTVSYLEFANEGTLRITASFAFLEGSVLENSGLVHQTGDISSFTSSIPTSVTNAGQWFLADSSPSISVGLFTNDRTGVVTSTADSAGMSSLVENSGEIRVEQGVLTMTSDVTNTVAGTLVVAGGSLVMTGVVDNQGIVVAHPGATVQATDAIVGAPTLSSGTWIALPGGTINLGFDVQRVDSGGHFIGGTTSCPDFVPLPVIGGGGTCELTEDSVFTSPVCIEAEGSLGVENETTVEVPAVETQQAGPSGILGEVYRRETFSGPLPGPVKPGLATLVTAQFTNNGLTSLGTDGDHGDLHIIGNFTQSQTGVLEATMAGTVATLEHDRLVVEGDVALAGTLRLVLDDAYTPEGGEQFTIVTAVGGTVTGRFDAIDAPGTWSIDHQPGAVVATFIDPDVEGDATGDGVIDVADVLAVLAAWGPCDACETCPADVDDDCVVSVNDLLLVLANWSA